MPNIVSRSIESLKQVAKGLKTVLGHSLKEPVTEEFPDVVPQVPPHFRGRLALTVNPETGEHLCISCRQCERVCPDKCIEITAHKSPETNKLELIDFKIDHGLCMFCGLCTEVCPTLCIINTSDFEMADYSREALIFDIKKLTLSQGESAYYFSQKEMPLPKPKPAKAAPAAAKPAEGAAKPAAPAAKPAEGEAKAAPAAKPAEGEAKAAPAAKPAEGEAKAEEKPEAKAEDKTEAKADEKKAEAKADDKKEDKPEAKNETKEDAKSEDKPSDSEKSDEKTDK